MRATTLGETSRQDLRHSLRQLRRNPRFAAAVVLTLSLGIGANTAIFTVFNSVILQPLPIPQPGRVLRLWHTIEGTDWTGTVSYLNLRDWIAQNNVFEGLASWMSGSFNLKGSGNPEHIPGAFVSANYFDVMGVQPILGRTFRADEDKPGSEPAVVLSETVWKSLFATDP